MIPEVAQFMMEVGQGAAKVAATGHDARSGGLGESAGLVSGFAGRTRWVILLFIP